jgi:peptide/nickel transport system substrate-binding protein
VDAAKRLLADSGYAGQPATLMAPQEVPALKAWGDVTVDLQFRPAKKCRITATSGCSALRQRVRKNGWLTQQSARSIVCFSKLFREDIDE